MTIKAAKKSKSIYDPISFHVTQDLMVDDNFIYFLSCTYLAARNLNWASRIIQNANSIELIKSYLLIRLIQNNALQFILTLNTDANEY